MTETTDLDTKGDAPAPSREERVSDLHAPREQLIEDPTWVIVRRIALATYAIVLVFYCWQVGIPIGHDRIFLWAGAGLLVACIGKPWRAIPQLLIDWVPFVAVVIVYDYTRGVADNLGISPHYVPQIDADKLLFFGHVPTEFLQQHLYHSQVSIVGFGSVQAVATTSVQWFEVVFDLTYLSHYVASFILAGVLWARNRKRFQAYARRFCLLSTMGFLTYILFPAAPPWLAAQDGYISPNVGRLGGRGDEYLHLEVVRNLVENGAKLSNLVAAVPSLHAGYATLIAITLWPRARRGFWALLLKIALVTYPILMGLMLVATGEHYVIDILLGVVYALVAHQSWNAVERWWTKRGIARRAEKDAELSPPAAAPVPV